MSHLTSVHTGDAPVPAPTPGAGTLDDVHYPPLPTGQGFHFPHIVGHAGLPWYVLVPAVLAAGLLAAAIVWFILRPWITDAGRARGLTRVLTAVTCAAGILSACAVLLTVAVVTPTPSTTTSKATGYAAFHIWAKSRYSIDIADAGYATLLSGQPTTTEYMGQRIEVTLVHGDDGLGYLVGSVGTQEMPVKPNAYGQSTVTGQGENGTGTSTGPGGVPLGAPSK